VFVLWIAVFKVSRYVSLASITAAAMLPAIVVAFNAWSGRLASAWPFAVVTGVLAGLVIFKHRGNIARLRAGTELRVGAQRSA
jgi:glycerol-3-phosphate acyltransferase PlsY